MIIKRGFRMERTDIWIFVIIGVVVAANMIFRFLISANIIKPNKISKIFYEDDESFIKSWGKTQEKGILRFIIKNVIYWTAVVCVIILISKLIRHGWGQYQTWLETFGTGIMFGLINSLVWMNCEDRYNKIMQSGKVHEKIY